MTHVESASNVRRWDDNAIGVAIVLRCEIATLFPGLIPLIFQLFWLVGLVHTDECLPCLKKAQLYMIRQGFAGLSGWLPVENSDFEGFDLVAFSLVVAISIPALL